MLTKAQNKYIRSLSQQKYRKEHNVFIAEGDKIATEWLKSGQQVQMIVCTEDWIPAHAAMIQKHEEADLYIVKEHELEAITTLQTPNKVLLVVHMPEPVKPVIKDEWCIALDGIQDPGNMGTIIRIADWFGINQIVCSEDSVEIYNPKVIQSAMGGHLRVNVHTTDLAEFIQQTTLPVLAATLDGENVYTFPEMNSGVLLIGNESKGISHHLIEKADRRITIPRLGGAESLNAAVSAGILCALLKRS